MCYYYIEYVRTYVRVTDHSFQYGFGLVPPNGKTAQFPCIWILEDGGENKRVRTYVLCHSLPNKTFCA